MVRASGGNNKFPLSWTGMVKAPLSWTGMVIRTMANYLYLLSGIRLWTVFTLFLMCCSNSAISQIDEKSKKETSQNPLVELGDAYHNSIELLQNRFRIDYKVDEITMIFFRKFGSAPIVLVRPDGSKIFQSDADGENVFWYDSTTYDLINIKNPTPGPWQAVGQILPESRVMVISEIQLHADPLPDVLFSGEILKQTATLTNGGELISNPEIRDVVSLEIKFISSNNPDFNNFGAETKTIATFEDNGRGMDEKPLDGVFTGQFNLSVASGEWTPVFVVSTPMFSREQINPSIMLHSNPIKLEMIANGGGDGYHKLVIDAEREFVEMETLLIDGKVRFPNGDVQNFSLTEQTPDTREYLFANYEAGVYRIKLTAYGNTKNGRNFILDVPEFTYLSEEPVVVDTEDSSFSGNLEKDTKLKMPIGELNPNTVAMENETEAKMSNGLFWGLILGINSFILIIGMGFLWFFLSPRKKSNISNDIDTEKQVGIFKKLKNKISRSKSEQQSASASTKEENGILDLSLPNER